MSLKRKHVHQSKIVWAASAQVLLSALAVEAMEAVIIASIALLIIVFRIWYTDTQIGERPTLD
jgi:hypothetical protein